MMKSVGWAIGNDREEFLAGWRGVSDQGAFFAWARHPDFALLLPSRAAAVREILRMERPELFPLRVWDAGAQWLVEWPDGSRGSEIKASPAPSPA